MLEVIIVTKTAQLTIQHRQHNTTQHNTTQLTTQHNTLRPPIATVNLMISRYLERMHLLFECTVLQVQSAHNLQCYFQAMCSKNSRSKDVTMLSQQGVTWQTEVHFD
jgi:hypothetical protein